jgi:predicted helicase
VKISRDYNFSIWVTTKITDKTILSPKDNASVFPLYLYIKNGIADDDKRPYHKHPNLNDTILREFSAKTGLQFSAEPSTPSGGAGGAFSPIDILDYIYAILHSSVYRNRYKEFLKIDFPRVPYPKNAGQFWQFVSLGAKLRRPHLLDNVEPEKGIAVFPEAGSSQIENISPVFPPSPSSLIKIFINSTQYFDNVPPEAWTFYIGGYQPAQKWLKDRKGKTLSFDDVKHYRKIIRVLKETGELMQQIDKLE